MEMVFGGLIFLIGGAIGFAVSRLIRTPVNEASGVEAKARLAQLEIEIREYTGTVARLETEKTGLKEKLTDQQQYIATAETRLQAQFENLAQKIFTEKNSESKRNLAELLNPLKEELGGFKKHITESFGNHAKEQFALKREIENIVKVSGDMKLQTESLTKALKGDTKVQGNWGEMILERILESSGLRKGTHYIAQAAGMGLKHPETGTVQKPDFVVHLPDGKHAVIDSKVSLTHYERYCAEDDDALRAQHLTQFLQSVRNHARGLEDRRYQDTDGLKTPEFVLMFIPIEGAYALAMQQDGELHAHAWGRKIIIVCPNTLFAILKMMDSMWKLDDQNRNVGEIVTRGGRLYDKFAGFLGDMETIGTALSKAHSAYDDAFNKLSKGPGNLLNQANDLVKLGAKASKKMPKVFAAELEPQASDVMLIEDKSDAA